MFQFVRCLKNDVWVRLIFDKMVFDSSLNKLLSITVYCPINHFLVVVFQSHFTEHQTNSNIIFQTSNDLKHLHLLVIELKHPIFGFERSNINSKIFCTFVFHPEPKYLHSLPSFPNRLWVSSRMGRYLVSIHSEALCQNRSIFN